MTPQQKEREAELITVCLQHSGEYVPAHHPSTSFATTYSHDFVKAAADLYLLYQELEPNSATLRLYLAFKEAGVPACRGGAMTIDKLKYLLDTRVNPLINFQL